MKEKRGGDARIDSLFIVYLLWALSFWSFNIDYKVERTKSIVLFLSLHPLTLLQLRNYCRENEDDKEWFGLNEPMNERERDITKGKKQSHW